MDDEKWNEWFNGQYELNERIHKAIDGLSVGKPSEFKTALWASVIEYSAEALRNTLP